uniref:C-type lectin domain-containing protein n=1 Tax=Pygocentrus nattereri TaxID=42514 RepID=A0AAR2KFU0_PYGNA
VQDVENCTSSQEFPEDVSTRGNKPILYPPQGRQAIYLITSVNSFSPTRPAVTNSTSSGSESEADAQSVDALQERFYCFCSDTTNTTLEQNCSATAKTCRSCPEDWTYLEGKCYYFSKDKLDWKNSSDSCASMGSHLTILHTQQQHDHLEKIAHDIGGLDYHFWIGLSDSEEEGVWKWVDNTLVNKTYWSETPKEPNNHETGGPHGEDCVVLQSQSKTWFDVPCDFHYKRICEMGARLMDRNTCGCFQI